MSLSKDIQGLGGYEIPSALGHRTVRLGTTDLAAEVLVPLFNVLGGEILLTALVGRVTHVMDAGATIIQLHHTPSLGLGQVDLCATITAHIGSDIVGTQYTITGVHDVDMVTDAAHEGVSDASFVTNMLILVPGVISMDVTGAANTGVIEWTIHWVPLAERVRVTVA